jgi:hypothetical protein
VYLQWAVPNDFPSFAWMYVSIVASMLVAALIVWRKSRVAPGKRWPMRVGGGLLARFLCAPADRDHGSDHRQARGPSCEACSS